MANDSYIYQLEGQGYLGYNGMLYPIGVTPSGQQYIVKDGTTYRVSGTYGGRAVLPAGQAQTQIPPGAVGTDANGYYVDANHNVLALNGSIAGPPGSTPAVAAGSLDPLNTAIGGGPLPPIPSTATTVPVGVPVSTSTVLVQAGLPLGIAFLALVVVGGVVYYAVRTPEKEAPRLRSARASTRSYGR